MTERKVLPNRRPNETFEIKRNSLNYTVTVGFDMGDNDRIAEVFITGQKAGSELEAVARDGAVLLSLAMQHGVPLETIQHALTREGDGSASTIVGATIDRILTAK